MEDDHYDHNNDNNSSTDAIALVIYILNNKL